MANALAEMGQYPSCSSKLVITAHTDLKLLLTNLAIESCVTRGWLSFLGTLLNIKKRENKEDVRGVCDL